MPGPLKKDRRSLRRIWLEPRRQLEYGMYGFLFVAVAVVCAQVLTFLQVRHEALRVLQQAGGDAGRLTGIVDMAMRSALLKGLWVFLPVAAFVLFACAAILHRYIGPQVPVRRTLQALRNGEYGASCRIRASDELHDLVEDLNELSTTLEQRHRADAGSPKLARAHSPDEQGEHRQAGFSLIEVLVVLVLISILTALGVTQFLRAFDRSRQRATLADMRMVSSANGTFFVDNSTFPAQLTDLEPYYLDPVPPVDRWGYAWQYAAEGKLYELSSRGADGLPGPAAPDPWNGDPFECDLVLATGVFSQAPDL